MRLARQGFFLLPELPVGNSIDAFVWHLGLLGAGNSTTSPREAGTVCVNLDARDYAIVSVKLIRIAGTRAKGSQGIESRGN